MAKESKKMELQRLIYAPDGWHSKKVLLYNLLKTIKKDIIENKDVLNKKQMIKTHDQA